MEERIFKAFKRIDELPDDGTLIAVLRARSPTDHRL
jgi:hypothetical protein